jgi:hypothetical protein
MRRAYGSLYTTIQQQVLSYVHIIQDFPMVCAPFVPVILLLLKKNDPGVAPAGAH